MRIRLAIALTLMAIGVGGGSTAAQGAVVSGSNLLNAPNGYACVGQTKGCTLSIQDLSAATRASGGARAGIEGVIVGWARRTTSAVSVFAIRLQLTRDGKGVGVGPQESMRMAAGLHSFSARLPVKAGDEIGIDFEPPPFIEVPVVRYSATGSSMDLWTPVLGPFEARAPTEDGKANVELMVNATIEPDADKDGWGDETQDKCAGQADATNACAVPIPIEPVPDTKIKKVKIENAKATFRFSSPEKLAKFQCKLDKKRWKSCKSPKTYRGLKEGRHTFRVKAIGPTAVPDPTPAKRSFKIG